MVESWLASYSGLYVGAYAAGLLCGLVTCQTYIYFANYRDDSWRTRLLVLILWLMDTMSAVFAGITLYNITILSIRGSVDILNWQVPWTISAAFFLVSLTDAGVKGFYCHRIWIFSEKNALLTGTVAASSLSALAAGLYATSRIIDNRAQKGITMLTERAIDIFLLTMFISDTMIACSLCALLWKRSIKVVRTASITRTLMVYTVTTGLLTSVIAAITLILLLTMGSTLAYLSTLLILSKVYFSSMLATLNRRERLRKQIAVGNGALLFPPSGMVGIGSASYQGFLRAQPPATYPSSEARAFVRSRSRTASLPLLPGP